MLLHVLILTDKYFCINVTLNLAERKKLMPNTVHMHSIQVHRPSIQVHWPSIQVHLTLYKYKDPLYNYTSLYTGTQLGPLYRVRWGTKGYTGTVVQACGPEGQLKGSCNSGAIINFPSWPLFFAEKRGQEAFRGDLLSAQNFPASEGKSPAKCQTYFLTQTNAAMN